MKTTKVFEIMTPKPACVLPDWNLLEVMKFFANYGYGRAPVVSDFESMKLVGIISRSDIARYLIKKNVIYPSSFPPTCVSTQALQRREEGQLQLLCRLFPRLYFRSSKPPYKSQLHCRECPSQQELFRLLL